MAREIEKTVVSGVFSLDGQDFDVDNNVWLVGDDDEVLVIDAPHDAAPIVEAIGGRRVTAIVLTHGHNDHITAAVDAARRPPARRSGSTRTTGCSGTSSTRTRSPTARSPRARRSPSPGRRSPRCTPRATPPAAPACYAPDLGTVFTGDTLFCGGPGPPAAPTATSRRSSSRSAPGCSTLPGDTVVRTGHGDDTTIAAEVGNIA